MVSRRSLVKIGVLMSGAAVTGAAVAYGDTNSATEPKPTNWLVWRWHPEEDDFQVAAIFSTKDEAESYAVRHGISQNRYGTCFGAVCPEQTEMLPSAHASHPRYLQSRKIPQFV